MRLRRRSLSWWLMEAGFVLLAIYLIFVHGHHLWLKVLDIVLLGLALVVGIVEVIVERRRARRVRSRG